MLSAFLEAPRALEACLAMPLMTASRSPSSATVAHHNFTSPAPWKNVMTVVQMITS